MTVIGTLSVTGEAPAQAMAGDRVMVRLGINASGTSTGNETVLIPASAISWPNPPLNDMEKGLLYPRRISFGPLGTFPPC